MSNLKKKAFVLALIVAILCCGAASAQGEDPAGANPVLLTDDQERYPLGLHLELLEDPSGELTIEDVTSPEFDLQFEASQMETPNYGFTDSAYWIRLGLRNESTLVERWLLELGFANMHYVDLYSPLGDDEGFGVKQAGILRPADSRDLREPHIVFDIKFQGKKSIPTICASRTALQ